MELGSLDLWKRLHNQLGSPLNPTETVDNLTYLCPEL